MTILFAFGDSITVGYSSTVPSNAWSAKVAAARCMTLDNRAVSGNQIQDTAARVYSAVVTSSSKSVWLAGYNDYRYCGTNPLWHETYKHGIAAMAVWLAIPECAKVRARAASVSGSWLDTYVYGNNLGKYSNTQNSTLTFQVSGTVVYVASIAMQNPVGGILGVSIDGVPVGVGHCYGSAPANSGVGYSPYLMRFDGLAAGLHTVVVSVESASAGNVFVDWVAGNSVSGPAVRIAGPLRFKLGCYDASQMPAFNNGSVEAADKFNQTTREIAAMLADDGLDVGYVDANSLYAPDTGDNDWPDVHPNDSGHQHIADAFLGAI